MSILLQLHVITHACPSTTRSRSRLCACPPTTPVHRPRRESVPVRVIDPSPEGLPIGEQIAARPWREDIALAVARHLEEVFGGWRAPSACSERGGEHLDSRPPEIPITFWLWPRKQTLDCSTRCSFPEVDAGRSPGVWTPPPSRPIPERKKKPLRIAGGASIRQAVPSLRRGKAAGPACYLLPPEPWLASYSASH